MFGLWTTYLSRRSVTFTPRCWRIKFHFSSERYLKMSWAQNDGLGNHAFTKTLLTQLHPSALYHKVELQVCQKPAMFARARPLEIAGCLLHCFGLLYPFLQHWTRKFSVEYCHNMIHSSQQKALPNSQNLKRAHYWPRWWRFLDKW